MTILIAVFIGLLGLVIGSFLNVVIWRVPRGESVVSPPSACPGCGASIAPRDNIPVLSWLLLRGRCRSCGEPISGQYPIVEFATGLLFVATFLVLGLDWTLPAFLYLAAISIALFVIDLQHKRLPDRIVLPSYLVAMALLMLPAAVDGEWPNLLRAALAGLALFIFYFALAFIYPAGMGGGDIKLSGVLGIYLGWIGWGAVIVGGFAGFFLGAVLGVGLMLLGVAGRKSKVPFGPFMILGTYVGLLWGQALAEWYLTVTFG